jgi:DNA processing protein
VGANVLIRDGAAPLLSSDDLIAHYPEAIRPREGFVSPPPATAPLPEDLGAEERAVVELLGSEPVLLDELVGRTGRPPHDLLAALCALEIAGVVEQQPGRRFRRI